MKSAIRWKGVLELLAYSALALAASLVAPLLVALLEADAGLVPLLGSMLCAAASGGLVLYFCRAQRQEFNHREGILLVVLTWLVAGALGALPFYFSTHFGSFTDAFFESVSGFTTTGATVLSDIESLPRSLLFWRSFTHWLGGMGIILLGIAILPLIGTGGMELYRAEFSGARSGKLKPRIAETATALWRVYAALTATCFLLLMGFGMGPFDAICHTFSTLGTGGFSTRNASVEAFSSPALEVVLSLFMLLAGINFTLHHRCFVERRLRRVLLDRELRLYFGLALGSTMLIALWESALVPERFLGALRHAFFQVASIQTTTGFTSTDFELWTPFSQLLLLALMFCGGCTGSTAGGLKMARIDLLVRVVQREFKRMVERRGVFAVHSNGRSVSEATIQSVLNLVYLAFLVNFFSCILLTALGVDVLTAIAAVAASMFNIGPGLGEVGPTDNYGHFSAAVKWVLSFCMLAGRLEFYSLIVVMSRMFWRK